MKASDYIAQFFVDKGITTVFGYIGGMVTHLVDSLDKNQHIQFVQTYHEQTAAIAAEGYALESGKPGVAIATSGPGATNLLTGIADAYFGSVPTIFITGQVNTYEYKYNKPIRQQGFQETDVVSIVKPITKYSVMIDDVSMLKYELEKAHHIATSGRKGPVLIDLPMDISRAEINPDNMPGYTPENLHQTLDLNFLEFKDSIIKSRRPMILIGGGCRDCSAKLEDFIRETKIPFVTSLMGKGIVNETSDLYLGMVGSYGNRCANIAISQCDLLIALGTRLDTRQTGAKIDSFIPNSTIIHVDIDNDELENHRLKNRILVNADVSDFLDEITSLDLSFNNHSHWNKWAKHVKSKYNQDIEIDRFVENKAPYRFMKIFNEVSQNDSIITTDIGQNQMWVAQSVNLKDNQKFFTSGGLAPMGFSLPAAIGAAFANPDKIIYCFNGDGGFHMACQSLLLISQYNLNISVIVLNNKALGMITQFQHLYFNDNMAATTEKGGYFIPNIKAMCEAYNLSYSYVDIETLSVSKLSDILSIRPGVIEYQMDGITTVSPKLEYNQPIYNPSPYMPKDELNAVIHKLLVDE